MLHKLKKKGLFLDRDGVINIDSGFVYKPEECVFVEGIIDFLHKAKNNNYLILIITNQSGIGRGLYKEQDFHIFMNWMNKNLNYLIDDYYFCPYHEKLGIGKYKRKSFKRKPNPGMILDAINDYNIDVEASVFVGDQYLDMIAARRANIKYRLLFDQNNFTTSKDYQVIKTLKEAQEYLI